MILQEFAHRIIKQATYFRIITDRYKKVPTFDFAKILIAVFFLPS